MLIIRQSTARTFIVGPVLAADGSVVTNCVIGDFKISKNGAAPGAFDGAATLTHRGVGFYSLAATETDLSTVGQGEIVIDDGSNTAPVKELTVIDQATYDLNYGGGAPATDVALLDANRNFVESITTVPSFRISHNGITYDRVSVAQDGTPQYAPMVSR